MTTISQARNGVALRAYLLLRPALQPLMRAVLSRRLRQGKEDAARYREKLGEAILACPGGKLI